MTEELVRLGHEVTLFATGDSRTNGRLRAIRDRSLFESYASGESPRAEFFHLASAVEALADSNRFDVIHFHLGSFSAPLSRISTVPMLHTLPSPLYADDLWMLTRFPGARMIARSRRQLAELPAWRLNNIQIIYNGCDFHIFTLSEREGAYLAFLGRMAPDKNPLDAIRIARLAGMPIVLAGEPWDEDDHAYFDQDIRPLIDDREVTWIGPVDDIQKNEFLNKAAAMLFPICWEEPFGNVMIEAMACGVPVLAYNRGSVSEVVDAGITGFFAGTGEELAALVPQALALSRREVRAHAQTRFSRSLMAASYVKAYEAEVYGSGKPAEAV
jgi:glycosyltransferase involved in cell wall biosynthesis